METTSETNSIGQLNQAWRVVALILNVFMAWLIYWHATGSVFPTGSGASVWILAAMAYWLLVLVAAPFFLPPRDSLSTAISAILLTAPIDLSLVLNVRTQLEWFSWFTVALSTLVVLAALISIFHQRDRNSVLSQISYRLSSIFGKGEILFTPAVVISAVGFYQSEPVWMLTILCFWIFVVIARPVELLLRTFLYLQGLNQVRQNIERVGSILRIDDPNVVHVALVNGTSNWKLNTVHITKLPDGSTTYVLPLFAQTQNNQVIGTGLTCPADSDVHIPSNGVGVVYMVEDQALAARVGCKLSGDETVHQVVGIVEKGSSIASIKFRVIDNFHLEEGMVIFTQIRNKKIYYQILDANTNEEDFQQNHLGFHVALASQLGCYEPSEGFQKFPWLPDMNQPLFLTPTEGVSPQVLKDNEFLIGKIPHTPFGVPVILDDLVEYHSAVLGITGTGKTELALELVCNALDRDTKVFCVDFTGEYKARLSDKNPLLIGLSPEQGKELEDLLFAVETGTYGAPKEKAALKAFVDTLRPEVEKQIEAFLVDKDHKLGIFELAEITNTKATLRTTELYLSAIMDWARKNRRAKRILIVLEEAHTIIPEVYGSGFDTETQWVVGRIGQIALQGRKYGVGLLIVSQRTALVSKTILSQCNTYFTHALVDKTSLEYLNSVYSAEHVRAIPNLRFLEFIAYGKAVKSERPLLARREYDPKKAAASKELNVQHEEKGKEVVAVTHRRVQ